jgi:hypothetical protein
VAFSSLANLLLAAFLVLGPVVADRTLGGPSTWAVIMAALGVGSLFGGLVAFRIRPRHPLRTGIPLVSLCALPALALASHQPVAAVAAITFLAGLGLTVFNTLWETSLQTPIPEASLSRVGAYDAFGSFACQPLGQAVAGPLAAGIGLYPTLWLAGGTQLAITALAFCLPAIRACPPAPYWSPHIRWALEQPSKARTPQSEASGGRRREQHPGLKVEADVRLVVGWVRLRVQFPNRRTVEVM